MLTKPQWLSGFASELRALTRESLDHGAQFVGAVALQEWERLCGASPGAVARRWAVRSGLRGDLANLRTPMLIWLSECGEQLQRQHPSLGHNIGGALALRQWDIHSDLRPRGCAALVRLTSLRRRPGKRSRACAKTRLGSTRANGERADHDAERMIATKRPHPSESSAAMADPAASAPHPTARSRPATRFRFIGSCGIPRWQTSRTLP